MTRKRTLLTYVFLLLRKIGLLCKKEKPYVPKLKIQKSLSHKGETIDHKDFMFAKNALMNINDMGKERKLCHYDFRTHTCRCGITLDDLKNNKQCPIKK
jgi:hypothetical protein